MCKWSGWIKLIWVKYKIIFFNKKYINYGLKFLILNILLNWELIFFLKKDVKPINRSINF